MSIEFNLKHVWTPGTKMAPEVISWLAGTHDDTQTHMLYINTQTPIVKYHTSTHLTLPYHAEVTECTGGDEPMSLSVCSAAGVCSWVCMCASMYIKSWGGF